MNCCCHGCRPVLDLTLMFKLLFIGHPFAVRSERQLIRDVRVNVAYPLFLDILASPIKYPIHPLQNRIRQPNVS
ncbi:transposase [Halioxenophilus aromaticivorans]|uniref:transposase n=1 Tax=Halioxenophilus aromaticivorans TaxID=1306992 RepID=UPI003CD06964